MMVKKVAEDLLRKKEHWWFLKNRIVRTIEEIVEVGAVAVHAIEDGLLQIVPRITALKDIKDQLYDPDLMQSFLQPVPDPTEGVCCVHPPPAGQDTA